MIVFASVSKLDDESVVKKNIKFVFVQLFTNHQRFPLHVIVE